MRVLLDTNVLLIALPSRSNFHFILTQFSQRKFKLVITAEIFLEYEEILTSKANSIIAYNILNAFIEAPNIIPVDIYYKWNIITADADDNKFIDAYLAASADYLITFDRHFNEAKHAGFPHINIITPVEFLEILRTL